MPAEIVKQRLVEIKARVECVKAHLVGPPANTLGGQLFSDLLWMIERLEAALAREAALVQIGWTDRDEYEICDDEGVCEVDKLKDISQKMNVWPVRCVYVGPVEWVVGVPIDANGFLEDVEAHVFATEAEAAAFLDSLKAEAGIDPTEEPREY